VPVEREAGWLSGSCLLVRREAFDSVGGFDEGYFMYFEDVDLGERLGRAGWLNVYAPDAEVVHTGAHSTKRHAEAMLAEHHRSAYRYLSSHYQGPAWLPVRFALRGALAVRELLARRRERSRSDAVTDQS
jgi:N-acetylglucosaminyl-diphospho-decaprenol L-rhamnosyltransferase